MNYTESFVPITDPILKQFNSYTEELELWANKGIKYIRYVIDKNNPVLPIHFSGTTYNEAIIKKKSFNELSELITSKSHQNLTILKSLYNRVDEIELLKIINQPFISNNKYLIELLKDSNGYLIYQYQLEKFIQDNIGYNMDKAIGLRRSWNKKVIKEREVIFTNTNYYLIENRMPFYFVFKKSLI
jgi:hypothetical protein